MAMKTVEEILKEAPISRGLQMKIAFLCTECKWWTNDWNKCKRYEGESQKLKEKGFLYCGACQKHVKELPLEHFLETTLELRKEDEEEMKAFLGCFSDNWEEWHSRPEEKERSEDAENPTSTEEGTPGDSGGDEVDPGPKSRWSKRGRP